jgi:hypothetical protein
MEFQSLDFYCFNLIYEIEAGRNRLSAPERADAYERQARKRGGLLQLISSFGAALPSVPGQARLLRNLTHWS